MPTKEITELRKSGKIKEALELAKTELEADPNNIWCKRNISWVYYDYLKQNSSLEHFDAFMQWINEIKNLELPVDEKMILDKLSWQIGKMVFSILDSDEVDLQKGLHLFEVIKIFDFPKPSEGYSFMFKAFHKLFKETDNYVVFANWWDFKNFMSIDFEKAKLTDGKEIMAIAEQGYIAYAKHLLPKQIEDGRTLFNKEQVEAFLPLLSKIVDSCPQFQYPAYYNAKLLLALGNKQDILGPLLSFAKKKQNDFWVWEILAEAFPNDQEKAFACYCRGLLCKCPEEMLVNLRQKMARILIAKQLYKEAKTEIDILVDVRTDYKFKIPNEIMHWQNTEWYKKATVSQSNIEFYKSHAHIAEAILFSNVQEEMAIVDFINSDKKMLNFIISENKFGFFKYARFLKEIKVGDLLKLRCKEGTKGGIYQIYTAVKTNDETAKKQFVKEISGVVKIEIDKPFGFIDNVFIHPSLIKKYNLINGMQWKGQAIKSYNQGKKQWGWKLL